MPPGQHLVGVGPAETYEGERDSETRPATADMDHLAHPRFGEGALGPEHSWQVEQSGGVGVTCRTGSAVAGSEDSGRGP